MKRKPKRELPALVEWKDLEQELKRIIDENSGNFPSKTYLQQIGETRISNAIGRYHGGFENVRERLGYRTSRLSREKMEDMLWIASEIYSAMQQTNGEFPDQKDLNEMGRGYLVSAIKYQGGFGKVKRLFGFEIERQSPQDVRDLTWVTNELKEVIKENEGKYPSNKRLEELGRSDLSNAINRHHGGAAVVRRKLGYGIAKTPTEQAADFEWVRGELETIMEKRDGEFPSANDLTEIDRGDLRNAIQNHHGGFNAVRAKFGKRLRTTKEQAQDFYWLGSQLYPLILANRGQFPTQSDLKRLGRADIAVTIQRYHGGAANVQKLLGFKVRITPTENLKNWDWLVDELKPLIEENQGNFPNLDALTASERYDVIRSIQNHHGGFIKVQEKMGYKPGRSATHQLKDILWLASQIYGVMADNGGEFPTDNYLQEIGRHDIIGSVERHHRGWRNVRKIFAVGHARVPSELLRDWNWIYSELEKVVESNNGKFPTQADLVSKGRVDLVGAIGRHHGGHVVARERYESRSSGMSSDEKLESMLDTYIDEEAA